MIRPVTILMVSGLLFAIGAAVLVARNHSLIVLLGIELLLQATNLALAALTAWFGDWSGQVAMVVIAVIAAAELAVGIGAALAYSQHLWARHEEQT